MDDAVSNFVLARSVRGPIIIPRHHDHIPEFLFRDGTTHIEREIATLLHLVNKLTEGAVVVDAGANVGLISLPIAQALKAKKGAVYAWEPQRMLAYALQGSAVLNDLDNLFVRNMALGARHDRVNVSWPDYGVKQDFGLFRVEPRPFGAAILDIETLDSHNLPRLDLLKIDVEGMESAVLKGAANTILRHKPMCWIEYFMSDVNAIKECFAGMGYSFWKADYQNMFCATSERIAELGITVDAEEM